MGLHSAKASQWVGVTLTFIIEAFFSFLAGWTMYDEFSAWGFVAAIVVGVLAGSVFLLLGLYVFILREYAIDANKIFSRLRGEHPNSRLLWAIFLVALVIVVESFINANRMTVLPLPSVTAKWFLWAMFQGLVFVPLALGKLVHGHINATDPRIEEQKFLMAVDQRFYHLTQKEIGNMSLPELARLRQGNTTPLVTRMQDQEQVQDQERAAKEIPEHPLAQPLRQLTPDKPGTNGKK